MENITKKPQWMIGIDCETGGIGDEVSLLTAYFGFYELVNGKFELRDELDLQTKPNDGIYRVTGESLDINKINLVEHDKIAITEREAGRKLYAKLSEWHSISKDKLIPVGHNVPFDIRKITNTLMNQGTWETFVSYRTMDTCTIAQFYRICGKLPDNLSCSLGHLAGYYKVNVQGNHHEAKTDVQMTIGVLENLMRNI